MSAVPVNLATPLGGGEWFSGMTLVLTAQMVWQYGLTVGITNDKKRQILLNLICFLCAINTTISYGFNATKASLVVSDVTTMITFLCVQYSLVILNHNTIVRATNIGNSIKIGRSKVDQYCKILYVLPAFVLIPIYYSFQDTAGTGKAMNTSTFNAQIYKPLNIALLFGTEGLATVTDVLLLLKVRSAAKALSARTGSVVGNNAGRSAHGAAGGEKSVAGASQSGIDGAGVAMKPTAFASRDLLMNYGITWALILVDATIKILIAVGLPLLFDSIITITTVAMRSRANLQYGLELQALVSSDRRSVSNLSSRQRSTPYIVQPPASATANPTDSRQEV